MYSRATDHAILWRGGRRGKDFVKTRATRAGRYSRRKKTELLGRVARTPRAVATPFV